MKRRGPTRSQVALATSLYRVAEHIICNFRGAQMTASIAPTVAVRICMSKETLPTETGRSAELKVLETGKRPSRCQTNTRVLIRIKPCTHSTLRDRKYRI